MKKIEYTPHWEATTEHERAPHIEDHDVRGDFDTDEWGRDSFDWDEMLLSEIPWGTENAVSTRELAKRLNFTKSNIRKEINRLIDRGYFIGRNQVGVYQVRQGNERDLIDLSRWALKLKGDGYALLDQSQQLRSIHTKAMIRDGFRLLEAQDGKD